MANNSMDELKKAYRIVVIIGIAIVVSVFAYAVVVEYIKATQKPFKGFAPFPEVEFLRYLFFGLAAMQFFLIRFIRGFILSKKDMTAQFTQGKPSVSIQQLTVSSIITFALCEAVAIYGLILFFIAGNSIDFYIFLIISLIYFAVYFPRYSQWEEEMKKTA